MNIIERTKQFSKFLFVKYRKVKGTLPFTEEDLYRSWYPRHSARLDFEYIQDQCISTYGVKGADIIYGCIRNYLLSEYDFPTPAELRTQIRSDLDKYRKAIHNTYTALENLPLKYILKSLGGGVSGIVMKCGKDKIQKISYKPFNSKELMFIQYCLLSNSKVFPKIYSFTEKSFVRDDLKLYTQKCRDYMDLLDDIMSKEKNQPTEDFEVNESMRSEVEAWLKQVREELAKIFKKKVGSVKMDLHIHNLGETKSGDIVFFDPIGPKI